MGRFVVTGVIVPPSIAAEVAPLLRQAMTASMRRDGARFSDDAWAVLDDLDIAAAAFRSSRGVASGVVMTIAKKPDSGKLEPMTEWTVTEIAERLHIKRQAVLGRISRRTLPARKDARGRWLIAEENLREAS